MELDDTFFRRESARLVTALTRVFGVANLALAEDVVQETLAAAFEEWSYKGVPEHYSARLMTSAKNRAIDVFRRQRTVRKFAPEIGYLAESESTLRPVLDALFLPSALKDDELRMMFSCCHTQLDEEVQVALILRLLCGFGVSEIAQVYFATTAAIEKRITRGKTTLRGSHHLFELTAKDFAPRLSAVQRALYVLFSEGYHGASPEAVVRPDLCREAIRLSRLLLDHPSTATSTTHALAALMHLNAARLPARLDELGDLTRLFDQDRSRWDRQLVDEGLTLLAASAVGSELSAYHLEAAIAGIHASARRAEDTRWGEIVALYDALAKLRPSPVVALNRALAVAEIEGPERGLEAVRAITGAERLASYPFYEAALGELELRCGRSEIAKNHFRTALTLVRNTAERRFLARRISDCEPD